MKKDDMPIKIAEAQKIIQREWPQCPKYFLSQATTRYCDSDGREGVPCTRSGEGKRAHKYVKMADVREYLSRLVA